MTKPGQMSSDVATLERNQERYAVVAQAATEGLAYAPAKSVTPTPCRPSLNRSTTGTLRPTGSSIPTLYTPTSD